MSTTTLQTIAIVAQGLSAIIILFITCTFNRGIKKIENSRRQDEEEIALHTRNQLRVEYIFKLEEHIEKIKERQHNLKLLYQDEVEDYIDFFVLNDFLNDVKHLKERYELDNSKILKTFNSYFIPKPWGEQDIEDTTPSEGSSSLIQTLVESNSLRREIKKDILKLEVQTLINSTEYLEQIKEIEQELSKSTESDGHPILDITNSYLILHTTKQKLEYIYKYLKEDIER